MEENADELGTHIENAEYQRRRAIAEHDEHLRAYHAGLKSLNDLTQHDIIFGTSSSGNRNLIHMGLQRMYYKTLPHARYAVDWWERRKAQLEHHRAQLESRTAELLDSSRWGDAVGVQGRKMERKHHRAQLHSRTAELLDSSRRGDAVGVQGRKTERTQDKARR